MTSESRLRLRRATLDDVPILERWDTDPDVIAATTDDDATERAFGGLDWREELGQDSDVSYHLIAEVDGRPVGAMQVCDPHVEPTHYWGTIEPSLRAVDIWIGAETDRNKGLRQRDDALGARTLLCRPCGRRDRDRSAREQHRAIAFYQRLGYATVERRMFGDDDCFVLRLTRDVWQVMGGRSSH